MLLVQSNIPSKQVAFPLLKVSLHLYETAQNCFKRQIERPGPPKPSHWQWGAVALVHPADPKEPLLMDTHVSSPHEDIRVMPRISTHSTSLPGLKKVLTDSRSSVCQTDRHLHGCTCWKISSFLTSTGRDQLLL